VWSSSRPLKWNEFLIDISFGTCDWLCYTIQRSNIAFSGVEDLCGGTLEPRHAQGIDDDVALHVLTQKLARHLAAEQVDHYRQKPPETARNSQEQPAFAGVDVRDVRRPHGVWLGHDELPVQLQTRPRLHQFGPSRNRVSADDSVLRVWRWSQLLTGAASANGPPSINPDAADIQGKVARLPARNHQTHLAYAP